jgi:hypothetical protein
VIFFFPILVVAARKARFRLAKITDEAKTFLLSNSVLLHGLFLDIKEVSKWGGGGRVP